MTPEGFGSLEVVIEDHPRCRFCGKEDPLLHIECTWAGDVLDYHCDSDCVLLIGPAPRHIRGRPG